MKFIEIYIEKGIFFTDLPQDTGIIQPYIRMIKKVLKDSSRSLITRASLCFGSYRKLQFPIFGYTHREENIHITDQP